MYTDIGKALQLDEGLGTRPKGPIGAGGQGQQAEKVLGGDQGLEAAQVQTGLGGGVHVSLTILIIFFRINKG